VAHIRERYPAIGQVRIELLAPEPAGKPQRGASGKKQVAATRRKPRA